MSLINNQTPTETMNRVTCYTINLLTEYLEKTQIYTKVLNAICLLHKATRAFKQDSASLLPWINIWNSISSAIINCFKPSTEAYITKNKLKHLLIQPQHRIYYVSDRSFRSCISVPLICGKSLQAGCIMQDAHKKLGHGRDILQILSSILAEFHIPGGNKLVVQDKKTCPGCLKLNKKSFFAFEGDMPDILKTIQPPFSFCQANIFGPILAYNQRSP